MQQREENMNEFLNRYERKGITRYKLQADKDLPAIGEVYPQYSATYDDLKNDRTRQRRQVQHRLVSIISKQILWNRVENRIAKIKAKLGNAKNPMEVKKLVLEDWERAEYIGVGKKEHIDFKF
mmetsp:Transcript_10635/g.9212  ORF Transcript_10635/g.9212 Transcript_10635/m.9212 type:complete len:123 (+) Transcript_10635:780-1148(+)